MVVADVRLQVLEGCPKTVRHRGELLECPVGVLSGRDFAFPPVRRQAQVQRIVVATATDGLVVTCGMFDVHILSFGSGGIAWVGTREGLSQLAGHDIDDDAGDYAYHHYRNNASYIHPI